MNRKEFLHTCGLHCAGFAGLSFLLQGCGGTKYLTSPSYRRYVVVQNEKLEYPICVYRSATEQYEALLMQCTHQGTELQVFGERLQCPAHGSEFTPTGAVQNGPADQPLRKFRVMVEGESIKINLS
jgi:nitrite reductase/ring-hydroxylating ferredoxin subunit